MNKQLLFHLYGIFSPSGKEKKMAKFISDYIRRSKQDITVTRDSHGNLYAVKGKADTYPCIVAHMDQVSHVHHSKDFKVYEIEDTVFGYSKRNKRFENLGADDKNGIFVALECLMRFPALKCAFFREEETGTIGSSNADMEFFTDCRYVLQCDRKGSADLITTGGWTDLCSDEFAADIRPEIFSYKPTSGALTDVVTLKHNGLAVSCVNISCGYYDAHTDEERTDLQALDNCLAFVFSIIQNCTRTYPHIYEEPPRVTYKTSTKGYSFGNSSKWAFHGDTYDFYDGDDYLTDFVDAYTEESIADYLYAHESDPIPMAQLYDAFHVYHPEVSEDVFLYVAELYGFA